MQGWNRTSYNRDQVQASNGRGRVPNREEGIAHTSKHSEKPDGINPKITAHKAWKKNNFNPP